MLTQDDNKNKGVQETRTYIPARIKVIDVTVQRVMCTSEGGNTEQLEEEETFNW